jgi:hypothetical protein
VTTDFRVETAGSAIAGRVEYRCAACEELVSEEEVVFAPTWQEAVGIAIGLTPDTRTYHPSHAPKEDQST